MIPKIIHYCWFGRGQKSELILRCIESWKKYCPDYEIIEWNEDNFDVNMTLYTSQAYETKKWAFVSDYARLYALYNMGGIYLDIDMELLKPFDEFLNNQGLLAFEANDYVCLGIIGAVKQHPFIKQLMDDYREASFCREDGELDMQTNVQRMRKYLLEGGLINNGKKQTVCGVTIYPQKYFFPYNFGMAWGKTPRTAYAVHHALGSWKDGSVTQKKWKLFRICLINKVRNVLGTDFLMWLKGK